MSSLDVLSWNWKIKSSLEVQFDADRTVWGSLPWLSRRAVKRTEDRGKDRKLGQYVQHIQHAGYKSISSAMWHVDMWRILIIQLLTHTTACYVQDETNTNPQKHFCCDTETIVCITAAQCTNLRFLSSASVAPPAQWRSFHVFHILHHQWSSPGRSDCTHTHTRTQREGTSQWQTRKCRKAFHQ